jgi:hypothetical protein
MKKKRDAAAGFQSKQNSTFETPAGSTIPPANDAAKPQPPGGESPGRLAG